MQDTPSTSSSDEIEIILKNESSKILSVDLANNKQQTLASVLSQRGYVEAACQEKLSCSTCVGTVRIDDGLPDTPVEPTEDELDVIDMVAKNTSIALENRTSQLRAGCKIPLKPGMRYTLTPLQET